MAYGSNTFITYKGITTDALRAFKNSIGFSATMDRGYSAKHFGNAMPKEGDTLWVRLPNRFNVYTEKDQLDPGRLLPTYVDTSMQEELIPFKINKAISAFLTYTDEERALDISEFSKRFTTPAGESMAVKADMTGTGLYTKVWNQIGDESRYPVINDFQDAAAILHSIGVDDGMGRWTAALSPFATAGVSESMLQRYNPQDDITRMYRKGVIGVAAEFNFIRENNIRTHTSGNYGASALLFADMQEGIPEVKLYNFSGLNGGDENAVIEAGDVFTIGDDPADWIYELNIPNKQKTGRIQQFTAIERAVWDSTAQCVIVKVNPKPIVDTTNPKRNMSRLGLADNIVNWDVLANTDYTVNLAYAPETFYYATVPLPLEETMHGYRMPTDGAYNLRFLHQHNAMYNTTINRLDIIYAMDCLNGGRAVRVKSLPRIMS